MIRQVRAGGVAKDELLARLRDAGVALNPLARELFADARFATSATPYVVETVERPVEDLGLPAGGTSSQLLQRAAASGLAACPLEVAPALRLEFIDQPEGRVGHPLTSHRAPPGSLTVASPLLALEGDTLRGFYLRRIEGTLWLRGYRCSADHVWSPHDVLVFARAHALGPQGSP